jgi:broad specificity phosphatase PhoE
MSPELVRLYLVRPARTALNADGRLRGRLDPSLDDIGRAEASALAGALAAVRLVRVVSSPLRRAVETAEAISGRVHVDVVLDERLADRDYGPWAGSTEGDVVAEFGSLYGAPDLEQSTACWNVLEPMDDGWRVERINEQVA